MKTLFPTLTLIAALSITPALANHEGHGHNHAGEKAETTTSGIEGTACEDRVDVKVNGLVCDFCARALEKTFGKREEVSGIKVDLDKGNVTVAMKPGQTIDDETLTQIITDSGYNVADIHKGC